MQDVYFVMTVTERAFGERFIRFIKEHGASVVFSMPAEGTAAHEVLTMLGLESGERSALFTVLAGEVKRRLMRGFVTKMGIESPGAGIALSIPLESVGGSVALGALLGAQEIGIGDRTAPAESRTAPNESTDARESAPSDEEKAMNTLPYALIVAIANSGCTDMVMDAARSAGACGGTILHVKGAGAAHAEKFFGMSIAAEKEMVLIAAARKDAAPIMKAVMAQAGLNTRAHAVCFSMPVDQIEGFRLPDDTDA